MIRLCLLGLLLPALPACTDTALDPPYPTASLVWEDELLGEWVGAEHAEDPSRFVVTRRKMAIDGDRVDPVRSIGGLFQNPPDEDELVDVLTITMHSGDEDFPDPIVYNAYLFQAGEHRILAFQPTFTQTLRGGLLVLPVHLFAKYELDGDSALITFSDVPVAWMPPHRSLDAPRTIDDGPIELEELLELAAAGDGPEGLGLLAYTSSIDRLIDFLARNAGDDRLWNEDEAQRFVRVSATGEPAAGDP